MCEMTHKTGTQLNTSKTILTHRLEKKSHMRLKFRSIFSSKQNTLVVNRARKLVTFTFMHDTHKYTQYIHKYTI